jgi:hypothetical protein
MNVELMQLYSGKNHWFAQHNALVANIYAEKVHQCCIFDKDLVDECDKVGGGRFFGMAWSEHFGFRNWCEAYNQYPVYEYVEPTRKNRITVWVDGNDFVTTGQDWTIRDLYLDAFKNPEVNEAYVKMAISNEAGCTLSSSVEAEWLSFSVVEDLEKLTRDGKSGLDTICLKLDREKLAAASDKKALLKIEGDDGHGARIRVNVHIDASEVDVNFPAGTFVQTTNYVSIEAPHFVRSSGFNLLEGYGKTLGAVKAAATTASFAPGDEKAPFVEYAFALSPDFVEKSQGLMAFDFYINPSNPAYKDNKLQFVAEVNGEKILKDAVDARHGDFIGELSHEHSRHQRHTDGIVENVLEVVLLDVDGTGGAHLEAVAAVDATVGDKYSLAVAHAKRLGGADLHAMRATYTGVFVYL